jgi:hypothetical protein
VSLKFSRWDRNIFPEMDRNVQSVCGNTSPVVTAFYVSRHVVEMGQVDFGIGPACDCNGAGHFFGARIPSEAI